MSTVNCDAIPQNILGALLKVDGAHIPSKKKSKQLSDIVCLIYRHDVGQNQRKNRRGLLQKSHYKL